MIIKFIVCWDTGYNLHFRHTGRCSGQSDIAKTTLASSLHSMILIPINTMTTEQIVAVTYLNLTVTW